jgi:hypothetical protein
VILLLCFISTFFDVIPLILNFTASLIALIGYGNYLDGVSELTFDKQLGISRYIELLSLLFIILFSNDMKKYFKSDFFNMIYALFFMGLCCKYLFLGSMLFRRISLYFIDYYFVIYGYALAYFAATFKTQVKNLVGAACIYLSLFVLYAKQIIYCESSTGAYVSFFQEDLHELKEEQRAELLSNMN